ncbi:MAG: hypothetical protein GYA29_08225 [Methanothrix sp.]|nr:hypothetical protein [Methanothrix sp.]
MQSRKSIRSKTKGMVAVVLVALAALAGMRLEFDSMQSPEWLFRDSKAVEGYQWLANSTENDAVVLAWWDYADGIEMIGHRGVVIREASQKIKNTIGGYQDPGKPWHKLEYALWYPYEPNEKVRDVAAFFISENATSAKEISRRFGADYALVMSGDLGKYFAVLLAAEKNFSDYVMAPKNPGAGKFDIRSNLKLETIYTKMVNGKSIEGFTKEFDNGQIRIYKIV